MISDITDGISIKLYSLFPNKPVELEKVDQDFEPGSFIISFATMIERPQLDNRYYRRYPITVRYFPESDTQAMLEMLTMQEALIDGLEYITVNGDLVRGLNRNAVIVDDILNVHVDYDVYILKDKESDPLIETLTIEEI